MACLRLNLEGLAPKKTVNNLFGDRTFAGASPKSIGFEDYDIHAPGSHGGYDDDILDMHQTSAPKDTRSTVHNMFGQRTFSGGTQKSVGFGLDDHHEFGFDDHQEFKEVGYDFESYDFEPKTEVSTKKKSVAAMFGDRSFGDLDEAPVCEVSTKKKSVAAMFGDRSFAEPTLDKSSAFTQKKSVLGMFGTNLSAKTPEPEIMSEKSDDVFPGHLGPALSDYELQASNKQPKGVYNAEYGLHPSAVVDSRVYEQKHLKFRMKQMPTKDLSQAPSHDQPRRSSTPPSSEVVNELLTGTKVSNEKLLPMLPFMAIQQSLEAFQKDLMGKQAALHRVQQDLDRMFAKAYKDLLDVKENIRATVMDEIMKDMDNTADQLKTKVLEGVQAERDELREADETLGKTLLDHRDEIASLRKQMENRLENLELTTNQKIQFLQKDFAELEQRVKADQAIVKDERANLHVEHQSMRGEMTSLVNQTAQVRKQGESIAAQVQSMGSAQIQSASANAEANAIRGAPGQSIGSAAATAVQTVDATPKGTARRSSETRRLSVDTNILVKPKAVAKQGGWGLGSC